MKQIISIVLAVVGTLCCGSISSVAADSEVACVWEVKSETNTIYFVGSLPFLREADLPLPPQIKMAFDRSEQVVFEVDPEESKDEAAGQEVIKMGMFMKGGSLKDTVSKKTYKQLGDLLAEGGGERDAMDRFRPWFASVMISMTEMIKLGGRPDFGVGDVIEDWALEESKPWSGLEGMMVELELLKKLPKEVHEYMLQSTLDELEDEDKMLEELDEGIGAWKRGDVAALEKMDAEDSTEMDELVVQKLLRDRSDKWFDHFEKTLAGETPTLYSIGLGHVIGEGNVLDKLEAKGFKVVQLKAKTAAPKKKKPGKKKKKPAVIEVRI